MDRVRATFSAFRDKVTMRSAEGIESTQTSVSYERMSSTNKSCRRVYTGIAFIVFIVLVIVILAIITANRSNSGDTSHYYGSNSGDTSHYYGSNSGDTSHYYGDYTTTTTIHHKPPHYGPYPFPNTTITEKPDDVSIYIWDMSKMMLDYHPCKDFYKYACGEWRKENKPGKNVMYNKFGDVRYRVLMAIRDLLDETGFQSQPEAVKKAIRLYSSCMDTTRLSRIRSLPLRTMVKRMRAKSATAGDTPDVIDMMISAAQYGRYPVAYVTVSTDAKDSSKTVIVLDQPYSLNLHYLTPNEREYTAYIHFIQKVVGYLNEDEHGFGTKLIRSVYDLVTFQHDLTQLTTRKNDQPPLEERYHRYKLGDLNVAFPGFDWKRYIVGLFSQPEVNITLLDNEPVIVQTPDYFRRAGYFLTRSKQSTVLGFIEWQLSYMYLKYLNYDYRTAYFTLDKEAFDKRDTELDRWETCASFVDDKMPNVTGRLFAQERLDPRAIDTVTELVNDIKSVVKRNIRSADWLDDLTKQKAIEKLEAMGELIGYPREIMNNTLLDQQYADLTFSHDFFANVVKTFRTGHSSTLRKLHQPTIRKQWVDGPTAVNAYYRDSNNLIVVPAGILREPFFSVDFDRSILYGTLGQIIGHEISHGFDNGGRKYDKDGNLANWWSPQSLQNYKRREKCFIDQYSSYVVPDTSYRTIIKLNGTITLGENIADNGGIPNSHQAYLEWVSRQEIRNVTEESFLGLTDDQLFYLAFAQEYCEIRGESKARHDAAYAVHSPGELRVRGTLQNSEHFAKAFNCSAGTEMNPWRPKCKMW